MLLRADELEVVVDKRQRIPILEGFRVQLSIICAHA